jgi:hypothetical protein
MTATLPRNRTTGRFIPRPPLPLCAGCGRVLFENLAAQVVGHTDADPGVLSALRSVPDAVSGQGDAAAQSDAPQTATEAARHIPAHTDPTTPTEETTT